MWDIQVLTNSSEIYMNFVLIPCMYYFTIVLFGTCHGDIIMERHIYSLNQCSMHFDRGQLLLFLSNINLDIDLCPKHGGDIS